MNPSERQNLAEVSWGGHLGAKVLGGLGVAGVVAWIASETFNKDPQTGVTVVATLAGAVACEFMARHADNQLEADNH